MGLININKFDRLEFIGNNDFKDHIYKSFFFKRNKYSMFKDSGEFNVKKSELSILRYTEHLMNNKKKWDDYRFKKKYLLRKRFKKQFLRIKNYIKKSIFIKDLENQYQIRNFFYETCLQPKIYDNESYNLTFFELLNLKMRLIIKVII